MKIKGAVLSITFLLSILFLTGCFDGLKIPLGDGESIQISTSDNGLSIDFEGQDGETRGISYGDGQFVIQDEDGKATVYGEIPDHFPKELPIPDNIDPASNFVTEVEHEDGTHGFMLTFNVESERKEEIIDLYERFIEDNQYEVKEMESVDSHYIVAAEKETGFVHLSVRSDEEIALISVNYTNYGEQSSEDNEE